jgi:hypothetical protein
MTQGRVMIIVILGAGIASGTADLARAADAWYDGWQVWGTAGYLGTAGHTKDELQASGGLTNWSTPQEVFISADIRYQQWGKIAFDLSQQVGTTPGVVEENKNVVTELYVDPLPGSLEALSLRIGRQRLKWGVMEFFHPIDTLEEPLNPFRVRQVIEGLDAVKLSYIASLRLAGTLLAIEDRQSDAVRFAARVDSVIADFDINLGAIGYFHTNVVSSSNGWGLRTNEQREYALFCETAGFIDELGIFGEVQWSSSRNMAFAFSDANGATTVISDPGRVPHADHAVPPPLIVNARSLADTPVWRAAVALQHERFETPKYKVRAEYFYNSGGVDARESQEFYAAFTRYTPAYLFAHFGEFGWWSQQYGALGISNVEIGDHLKLGVKFAAALDSGAAIMALDLSYAFDNNNGQVFLQYTRYGSLRDGGGFRGETDLLQSDQAVTLYLAWNFSASHGRR